MPGQGKFPYTSDSQYLVTGLWRPRKEPTASVAPWYLEVDDLLKAVILITEPTRTSDIYPFFLRTQPFLTSRLYNWKYVT